MSLTMPFTVQEKNGRRSIRIGSWTRWTAWNSLRKVRFQYHGTNTMVVFGYPYSHVASIVHCDFNLPYYAPYEVLSVTSACCLLSASILATKRIILHITACALEDMVVGHKIET
jgi:hypothetical protein